MPYVRGYCGVCVYEAHYGDCTCCGCPPHMREEDGSCRKHDAEDYRYESMPYNQQ